MTDEPPDDGLRPWWDLLREEWLRGEVRGPAWASSRARPRALVRMADDLIRRAISHPEGDWPRRLRDFVRRHDVPVDHPRHFGHFNPDPRPESILARALSGALATQLAVRPFSPAATALEDAVLDRLRLALGFDGSFSPRLASGGAATLRMVLLAALQRQDPRFADEGLSGRDYRVYRSAAGHLATDRAVRATGLGQRSVEVVGVHPDESINLQALASQVRRDRRLGRIPLLIVATLGTTVMGAVDAISELATFTRKEGLWLHVDGAWGGAALLADALRSRLPEMGEVDSFQVDLHKWPAIPQSLGFLLLRHVDALEAVVRGAEPDYFPRRASTADDHFQRDLDWSRPARGPEILATLAAGEGLPRRVAAMTAIGEGLRVRLRLEGWRIVNRTRLPLVCFDDPEGRNPAALRDALRRDGAAWLTDATLCSGRKVLRACITSERTTPEDLDALLEALGRARAKVPAP